MYTGIGSTRRIPTKLAEKRKNNTMKNVKETRTTTIGGVSIVVGSKIPPVRKYYSCRSQTATFKEMR
jgi:hypothetical protein